MTRMALMLLFILALPLAARAQSVGDTAGTAPAAAEQAAGDTHETDPTYAQRLALAQHMHEVRPARLQVEAAVDQAALSLPEMDREPFKKAILDSFDFDKLEDLSVNAMVEIFTLPELQLMADYYGAPEAASIAQKQPVYEEMLQPEIMKMLDKALMKIRTGAASNNQSEETGAPEAAQ